MTPRLARVALCTFAFLGGAIATNALYFQTRSTPPVRSADRLGIEKASWGSSRTAALQANSLKLENPPEPGATDGKPDTIRAIQRELQARGYGPLSIDGVPGLATRAAIMAFEADEGLPLTAIANEALFKVILLGAADPAAIRSAEPSARAQDVIRAAQGWLHALGYQPGPANGLMSEATRNAIRAFEISAGLPAKGRISADLVKRLADSVPLKSVSR
ncbi:MAG: peptidoglycan-binding domain-containing protein [Hyphomicrobiaceae bacterium]|nr:peptidoglycan-binding domain-containing protein [Hyphomicrobiaceae bacterium]